MGSTGGGSHHHTSTGAEREEAILVAHLMVQTALLSLFFSLVSLFIFIHS